MNLAWWRYLTVMVEMKTCDCVMTVLWSNHIRHHKIFRSGRHRRPPGRGTSRLCLPRCHRKGHTSVTGGLQMVSTDIAPAGANTIPAKYWHQNPGGGMMPRRCWPFICSRSLCPDLLTPGYCHKSPRCWRHAASVSRVTCCHAAGNKIPHLSHNSSPSSNIPSK